ncbi:FliM/FliN family flagellar motor switch protein [bacterium]|nr:FliM/FliN family flagellar motor switch protein [candidate division CSSED10-310 bacterium]
MITDMSALLPRISHEMVMIRNEMVRIFERIHNRIQHHDNSLEFPMICLPDWDRWEMQYKISVSSGDWSNNHGRLHHDDIAIIGRSPKAGICLKDGRISGAHCCLIVDGIGRISLMDLGSANGTWLDEKKLLPFEKYYINDKSKIEIFPYVLNIAMDVIKVHHPYKLVLVGYPSSLTEDGSTEDDVGIKIFSKQANLAINFWIHHENLKSYLLFYYGLSSMSDQISYFPTQALDSIASAYCRVISKGILPGQDIIAEYLGRRSTSGQDLIRFEVKIFCEEIGRSVSMPIMVEQKELIDFVHYYLNSVPDNSITDLEMCFRMRIPLACVLSDLLIPQTYWENLIPGDILLIGLISGDKWESIQRGNNITVELDPGHNLDPIVVGQCLISDGNLQIRIGSTYKNRGQIMEREKVLSSEPGFGTMICETQMIDMKDEPMIPIRAVIGSLVLTLAELSSLRPGMILNLKHAIGSLIDIRSNHNVIARGKLVRIDEEFGVEIFERVKVVR